MSKFKAGEYVVCDDATMGAGFHQARRSHLVEDADGAWVKLVGNVTRWHARRFSKEVAPTTTPCPTAAPKDNVHQPNHYARFVIEPITFINANGIGYNIGNVIKYVCRYDAKNGLEDLKKARRYIDIQIETMERQERVKTGENPQDVWKVTI